MATIPLELSDASGVPRYRQITDQIKDLIRAGELSPGQRLPSVRELGRQLLVSLITTRRAYAELEAAGFIVRRQGRGTFVAEDVWSASRARALEEAERVLRAAVTRARQLGMDADTQRRLLAQLLGGVE